MDDFVETSVSSDDEHSHLVNEFVQHGFAYWNAVDNVERGLSYDDWAKNYESSHGHLPDDDAPF